MKKTKKNNLKYLGRETPEYHGEKQPSCLYRQWRRKISEFNQAIGFLADVAGDSSTYFNDKKYGRI